MGSGATGAAATAKPNTVTTGNKENSGMGLFLIFFPEDQNKISNSIDNNNKITAASRFIRRTTSGLLFTKAQSTILICALLVFLTLLLFTFSTFEPSIPTPNATSSTVKNSRRFSSQKIALSSSSSSPSSSHWFFPMWDYEPLHFKQKRNVSSSSFALQGMGTLYRRGTKAMNDLIVSHVAEDATENELRLFLRVLHRSGVTSKADIVFLFGSSSLSTSRFSFVIREENESFLKLVQHYKELNNKGFRDSVLSFDSTQFWKSWKKDVGEPIWGKKGRGNYINSTEAEGESTRLTYGSVVGFDVNELDPENSLAGFLTQVPMSLRRWACYPMLLGRVRRNFNHIMLLDVKNLMLLSDPLDRVRNRSPESVFLFTKESSSGKHSKKNSDKTQSHYCQVNSAILIGGAKGIRRLANAMLTEIVRATLQHKKKKKNSISESGTLNQLVCNGYILKNVKLTKSSESIQQASSLMGLNSNSAEGYSIIQRGNSNHDLNSMIMKLICLFEADSSIYRDC